jgi:hypothetical protein
MIVDTIDQARIALVQIAALGRRTVRCRFEERFHRTPHGTSRAEEIRTVAEQMTDAEAKRVMFGVAATYELLAWRAEARLKREKIE